MESRGYRSSISMNAMSFAILSCSGSSVRMRHTPRRTQHRSNHYSLDKQAKTRADGSRAVLKNHAKAGQRIEHILVNKQRQHLFDRRSLRRFLSALVSALGVSDRPFSVVFITDEIMRRYNYQYRG